MNSETLKNRKNEAFSGIKKITFLIYFQLRLPAKQLCCEGYLPNYLDKTKVSNVNWRKTNLIRGSPRET